MAPNGALKVEYWAIQEGLGLLDLNGIDDFKASLAAEYVSQVHASVVSHK